MTRKVTTVSWGALLILWCFLVSSVDPIYVEPAPYQKIPSMKKKYVKVTLLKSNVNSFLLGKMARPVLLKRMPTTKSLLKNLRNQWR